MEGFSYCHLQVCAAHRRLRVEHLSSVAVCQALSSRSYCDCRVHRFTMQRVFVITTTLCFAMETDFMLCITFTIYTVASHPAEDCLMAQCWLWGILIKKCRQLIYHKIVSQTIVHSMPRGVWRRYDSAEKSPRRPPPPPELLRPLRSLLAPTALQGGAPAPRPLPPPPPPSRGLHSSTFQLNLSVLYGIGGAHRGCVARVRGCVRRVGWFCVSDTAQVELRGGRV
jgi:hypothetical protein